MARGLRPLFVTVTWGAGGSTAQKSLALAEACQRQLGLTTCLHLTCTNMSKAVLDDALAQAKEIGVRNILALRGDPPRNDEYEEDETEAPKVNGTSGAGAEDGKEEDEVQFVWAIDLVRYIRKHHGDYFCIGVAAYPEGHVDGSLTRVHGDPEHDLPYLVEKVKAGADFILTQLFYNVDAYIAFERKLREHESGVFASIPIIPGLMPIQSYQTLRRTAKLSHAAVPANVYDRLENVKHDDDAVKKVGVDILCEIVERIKTEPTTGSEDTTGLAARRGFHFYTLNLEKAVAFVLERSDLIPPDDSSASDGDEEVAVVVDGPSTAPSTTITINGQPHPSRRTRRASSIDPHNSVIVEDIRNDLLQHASSSSTTSPAPTPAEGTSTSPPHPNHTLNPPTIAISEGEGSLGRAATWDDFPNGRFGDSRSPAFGEIDGYGPSLPLAPSLAVAHWGTPTSPQDITNIFLAHVDGSVPAVPWSAEGGGGLSPETQRIKKWLREMNARGWWTVASQPPIDAASSRDAEVGWGPRNGWVWQKAFVEFWMPRDEWFGAGGLRERLEEGGGEGGGGGGGSGGGEGRTGEVSWYVGDGNGTLYSNMPPTAVNAVTWGCFPGKEILTPTIIEHVSFRAWLDEAFALWDQWAELYPRRSAAGRFLRGVARGTGAGGLGGGGGYVLVNVIHHMYQDEEGLWRCLGLKGDGGGGGEE